MFICGKSKGIQTGDHPIYISDYSFIEVIQTVRLPETGSEPWLITEKTTNKQFQA